MVVSQGRYELTEPNKLIILIAGKISRNVINNFMKCKNIPRLWRIFFLKIAKNRDYVHNFCNRPFNDFHRHCPERHLYNNTDGDEVNKNYGAYWQLFVILEVIN